MRPESLGVGSRGALRRAPPPISAPRRRAPGVPEGPGAPPDVGTARGETASSGAQPYGTPADYVPHHEPFQYYASTANPRHLAPSSLSAIGKDTATPGTFDTANHQYDMSDFDSLVAAINAKTLPPS